MVTFFSDRSKWLVVTLLMIQAGLLVHSAKVHSPTWDEVGHLAAGLSHWELGRFELYSVNPPLVRTIAAAPVYFFVQPEVDWTFYRSAPHLRSEVFVGRQFIEQHGESSFRHFFYARLAVIPIALCGGLLCFLWARELFGRISGLIALAIWTISPNVLAYGSLITPDLASAVSMLGASYVFYRWLKERNWTSTFSLAVVTAIAMLTKSVWLILPVLYFAIIGLLFLVRNREFAPLVATRGSHWGSAFSKLIVACIVALLLTNGFYGFSGSFLTLSQYDFVSTAFSGNSPVELAEGDWCPECDESAIARGGYAFAPPGNRFVGSILGSLPVPLPKNYLQGIDIQTRDFEHGRFDPGWKSYLLGQWKQGGWWYYYIVGLFFKVPLAAWLFVLLGTISAVVYRQSSSAWVGLVCLWAPAICLFLIISSATGLNRYVRYALPVLPVLLIWASQLGRLLEGPLPMTKQVQRVWVGASALAGVWLIISLAQTAPHYLSYFNEAAGGPSAGHRILCDSNIDWGLDLIELKQYLEQNPEASASLHLAYFGSFDPKSVGIEYRLPVPQGFSVADQMKFDSPQNSSVPEDLEPGWYVLSKNYVVGHSLPVPDGKGSIQFQYFSDPVFSYFDQMEPVDQIGNSMNVYVVREQSTASKSQVSLISQTGGQR